jgi:hypothetical protein
MSKRQWTQSEYVNGLLTLLNDERVIACLQEGEDEMRLVVAEQATSWHFERRLPDAQYTSMLLASGSRRTQIH